MPHCICKTRVANLDCLETTSGRLAANDMRRMTMLKQRFTCDMSIGTTPGIVLIVLGVGLIAAICAPGQSGIIVSRFLHNAVISGDSTVHNPQSVFSSHSVATSARTNEAVGRMRRMSSESVKAPAVSANVSPLGAVPPVLNFVAEPDVTISSAALVLAPMSRRGPPASFV